MGITFGDWKGHQVEVRHHEPCIQHSLAVMHHYGDNGEHYCPTGFLMCGKCGGVAEEPEPYECHRWGE